MTDTDFIFLANGGKVPKKAVEALNKLEERWPGATFKGARPAIVQTVMEALNH